MLLLGTAVLSRQVEDVVTDSGGKSCEVTIKGGAKERERAANLVNDAAGVNDTLRARDLR